MGKKNNVLVGYFSDPQRFADIYNGYYYGGRQEIRPELLEDASEKYDAPLAGKDEKGARSEPIERIRDIKKLYRGQVLRHLAM
ncbi:MAG: hypothetical protein IJ833_11280, partial [Lachnospiraceae bacterium]|nr:hypothetical protein [Lachnospiraceae bacterium]